MTGRFLLEHLLEMAPEELEYEVLAKDPPALVVPDVVCVYNATKEVVLSPKEQA